MSVHEAGWERRAKYARILGHRSARQYLLDELERIRRNQDLLLAELARVEGEIAKEEQSISCECPSKQESAD